ncbi:MAG: alpha/beta hydrolase [Thermomicrobia bacterium]|nr:alpha/beta hydrolase [Thermomicrobia bacterium]
MEMHRAESGPTHERIAVGPVTLHVARWAPAGPSLLLLPAMTQTWDAWLPVIPPLTRHFSVVAVDLRGHGASDHPDAGYNLSDYAADIVALTERLGWRQPNVIGHSLGGSVARMAEARAPGWARRIVIEDTPPRLDRADPRVVLLAKGYLKMLAMPMAEVEAHFRRVHAGWSEERIRATARAARQTAPGVLDAYLAQEEPLTLEASVAALRCPVLLIYGDTASGGFVSDADAALYLDLLPDGRALQIPGAGHSLHTRKPDDFLRAVVPFLLDTNEGV